MKKNSVLTAVLIIALAALSVSAQRPAGQQPAGQRPAPATPSPSTQAPTQAASNAPLPMSKMGVIYTEAFLDSKNGIVKFNALLTKLNGEFQKTKDDLTQMNQRSGQLQEEINKLQKAPAGTPIDAKSIQAKTDQLDQLKRDIQRKGEDAQESYNRRRAELFAPLQEDIGRALEVFAKARNINIIIDGTQVPLIYAAANIDITQPFINEFNSKNPVTASTTPPK